MRKRNNKLTYEEKMKIMEKIFSAVQCLSEGKIAHRCLHPDNIVVCDNGSQKPTFKICNFMDSFDLSQRIPEGNNTPNSITEYTAPEIRQFKRHSEKVDVWSLGMLLYWMLFAQTHSVMVNIEG
jgi:serine/threonine protein kinase